MTEFDKNTKLENLLHAINHDLRTPLGNIRSVTAILLQDPAHPLSNEHRTFINIIERSILRLLDQSNRLQMFGQVAFSRTEPDTILLSDVLANAKDILKSSYDIKEVSFMTKGDPLVPCYGYSLSAVVALLAAGDTKYQPDTPPTHPPLIQVVTEANHMQFTVQSLMLAHESSDSFLELASEVVQLHGGQLVSAHLNGRKKFSFAIPLPTLTD